MDNSTFWASYKAKCDEKGIAPLHEDAEAFARAMTEPPKPYSSDDFTSNKKALIVKDDDEDSLYIDPIEEENGMAKKVVWQRCNDCQEMKEDTDFSHTRGGGLQKTCKKCMADKISAGHKKKESTSSQEAGKEVVPLAPDASLMATCTAIVKGDYTPRPIDNKVAIMDVNVFYAALAMAYERGIAEGKAEAVAFVNPTITEIDIPVILDEVIGARA